MKTAKIRVPFLAVMFLCTMVAAANAGCGELAASKPGATFKRQAWQWSGAGAASLHLIADQQEPIVGFWTLKFISEGSDGIPDGTVVDQGIQQWHSDGTEITVSGVRPPVTGDVCLGVWKKTSSGQYKLSHYGQSFDTSNNFVGLAHITENVAVGPKGEWYSGKFTIDQYDTAGNLLVHLQGRVVATKITVDSATIVAF
jgi:hypothetical protein